jgi:formate dehydrogenase subunit delta
MEVDKLVRMANQIAANLQYGPDRERTAQAVADHLQRFWSPPMRKQIIAYREQGGEDLSPVAAMAVAALAAGKTTAA